MGKSINGRTTNLLIPRHFDINAHVLTPDDYFPQPTAQWTVAARTTILA